VSLRALTDDLILPPGLSIGGPATRTRRSDRIAGICRTTPIKNTGPIHIDLTEDPDSGTESIARRGPMTRGGAATGGTARKGPKTRGGGAAGGGAAARGGAATGGTARKGPKTRGGGAAARGGGAAARGGGTAARGGTTARGGTAARGGGAAARGGGAAARGGGAAAVQGRGGGNVSSSNQVKRKRIVTCIEKGIEIMESKMKRKERDWKP
jgi:hypothetical protein